MRRFLSKEFILFSLVGVSNTVINFIVYTILVSFSMPYLLANVIGYGVGMINSYLLNKYFVFQKKQRDSSEFLKFVLVNIITVIVHSILLYYFVSIFGWHKIYSQAFVTMITLVINFLGNKLWTFK
jgi:putative flippase GtrA